MKQQPTSVTCAEEASPVRLVPNGNASWKAWDERPTSPSGGKPILVGERLLPWLTDVWWLFPFPLLLPVHRRGEAYG